MALNVNLLKTHLTESIQNKVGVNNLLNHLSDQYLTLIRVTYLKLINNAINFKLVCYNNIILEIQGKVL